MKKVLALFVILTAVFFAACGKKQEQGTGSKEKVVVVSQGAKPKSLDPYMYNEIPGLAVTRQFYDSLFKKEDDGSITPLLAESYEYKTPTELWITLREGVKFHNGDILSVDDVLFSFQRMQDTPASAIMISDIDKVEAIDDRSFKIILKQSSAPLLFSLSHPLTSILRKYFYGTYGNGTL